MHMTVLDLAEHLFLSNNDQSNSSPHVLGYWHYDAINNLFELSDELKETLNLSDQSNSFISRIHQDDVQTLKILWQYTLTNKVPFTAQCRIVINDKIRLIIIKSRVDINNHLLEGLYGSVEDISELWLKEFEDLSINHSLTQEITKLKQNMKILIENHEKTSAIKSNFLSTMSHEIRTPMNAMLGFTKLLEDTKLSDEQNEYVMRIHDASTHLLSIMNDILDLSKMEAGKMTLDSRSFKLDKMINDVKDLLEKSANRKHLYFDIETMNCPNKVIGDAMRVKQILINLISNAIKFTEVGGISLVVFCEKIDDEHVMTSFKISDTGIGMTELQQQKLFSDFEQADIATSRKYGGTGLGLSISKKLADLMKGKITLESRLNEGTTFTLSLPLELDEDDEDDQLMEKVHLTCKEHPYILVAEDHILSQKLSERLLTQLGCQVKIVDNGEKALQAVKDDDFDLVFLDMNMPVMDGIEAAKAIRRFNTKTPLVALTANQYPEEKASCLLAGMNDILIKPVDKHVFIQILSKWVPED